MYFEAMYMGKQQRFVVKYNKTNSESEIYVGSRVIHRHPEKYDVKFIYEAALGYLQTACDSKIDITPYEKDVLEIY